MLKVTVTGDALEQRWVLQGRLTERFIEDLIAHWKTSRDPPSARSLIVDLNEVTSIDKSGEQALLMMINDGAEFIATGLSTKHLLAALQARTANSGNPD